jgi:hypothetical protein
MRIYQRIGSIGSFFGRFKIVLQYYSGPLAADYPKIFPKNQPYAYENRPKITLNSPLPDKPLPFIVRASLIVSSTT